MLDTSEHALQQIIDQSNRRISVPDLQMLGRVCDAVGAATILEIGSADGGSSVVLGSKAQERGGRLYCIEPQPKQRMVDNMIEHGLRDSYTLIAAASPWLGEKEKLVPAEIDLLFIDGRHDVRWALIDYHYFSPRVRTGGAIVFHDTGGTCQEDRVQPDYGTPDYVPLVQRAIDIIRTTDTDLTELDRSDARVGGAIAFRKGGL